MKLKPYKEKKTLFSTVKDIYSVNHKTSEVSVTIDVNGCTVLENFRRIIDYHSNMIAAETRDKTVYIYGNNITIATCNRYSATVYGEIEKIELFSKEVK